jgi:hypothetical protein
MSADPCPTCGRTVREAVEARMGQMRARSTLQRELFADGFSTSEIADIVTGVRSVAEVTASRTTTPQKEGNI